MSAVLHGFPVRQGEARVSSTDILQSENATRPASPKKCQNLTSNAMRSESAKEPSASPRRRQKDTEARRKSVELSRMRIVGAIIDPRRRGRASSAAGGAAKLPSTPPATPAPPPPPNAGPPSVAPLGSFACRNCSSAVRIICISGGEGGGECAIHHNIPDTGYSELGRGVQTIQTRGGARVRSSGGWKMIGFWVSLDGDRRRL